MALFVSSTYANHIWYVRVDATGGNTGTSWLDAFGDLQDALAVVQAGDEVWIAAGTYTPDRGTGDRSATFLLPDGVALHGGFMGVETSVDQRLYDNDNHPVHETILSGDLAGDDGPRDCAELTNCCTVHEEAGCDNAACEALVCDVFSGCCDVEREWASFCVSTAEQQCCDLGSGSSCENSFVVVTAGGVQTSSLLEGLTMAGTYKDPFDDSSSFPDTGLLCEVGCSTVRNCVFRDTTHYGIYIVDTGDFTISNSRFYDNLGVGLSSSSPLITVTDCTFVDNQFGIFVRTGLITNCLIQDSARLGAILGGTIKNCVFIRNGENGLATGGTTLIENCIFADNDQKGVQVFSGNVTLKNTLITRNNHTGLTSSFSITTATNCTILDNRAGGVFHQGGILKLNNCVLRGNHNGSAVRLCGATARINHCSIAGNYIGLGIHAGRDSRLFLNNSIVWGNGRDSLERTQITVVEMFNATAEINHSIVEGWTGIFGGVGNSGADPLFVRNPSDGGDGWGDNPDTPDIDESANNDFGDLRLRSASPAIDSGDPLFIPDPGETDFDGHPRMLCDRVDLGAFEFGIGDVNCDRKVNLSDFRSWEFCMTDPNPASTSMGDPNPTVYSAGCESFDFDADGDVDLDDYRRFMETFFEFSLTPIFRRPVRR